MWSLNSPAFHRQMGLVVPVNSTAPFYAQFVVFFRNIQLTPSLTRPVAFNCKPIDNPCRPCSPCQITDQWNDARFPCSSEWSPAAVTPGIWEEHDVYLSQLGFTARALPVDTLSDLGLGRSITSRPGSTNIGCLQIVTACSPGFFSGAASHSVDLILHCGLNSMTWILLNYNCSI